MLLHDIYEIHCFILASYSLSGSADHAVVLSPFTFTCNTGQTVDSIVWNIDGKAFPVSQASGTSCNSSKAPADYSYTCSGRTLYTLTIPSVSFSQHGSKWRCDHEFGGRGSQQITLEVYGKTCLIMIVILLNY